MDALLIEALQEQMNTERYNAAAYRALSYFLGNLAWDGTAKFMRKSSDEEQTHADKFADYLIARNIQPRVLNLNAPTVPTDEDYAMREAVSIAYGVEVITTSKINKLYSQAEEADDPQTCQFLHWFLDEQTKSVQETYDMVQELGRADCSAALLVLDEKYGED